MGVELDGANQKVIIDADSDTYLQANTDDTLDIYIAGAKDFTFTANTLTAQSGSTIASQALTATTIGATGVVSISDGTAGAPALTNTGDTNCGLYFSAADTLSFTAAGTAQFTMADGVIAPVTDSDVDIGTSSLEFKDGYFDGTLYCDTLNLAGTDHTAISGGLAAASQWRLTTDFTGDASPISSNWEEADAPTSFGILGSSITESSGVFTFPSTGYWLIIAQTYWLANSGNNFYTPSIYTTHDNSTWAEASTTADEVGNTNDYGGSSCSYAFDVTSTSNCKCALYIDDEQNGNTTKGSTTVHKTGLTFIKLGDT